MKKRGKRGKNTPVEPWVQANLNQIFAALRRERMARDMTLEQAAEMLGVVVPKISAMERGVDNRGEQANPLASFLIRWASIFDMEIRLVVETNSLRDTPAKATWSKLSKKDRTFVAKSRGLFTAEALAEKFGVSKATIYNVWSKANDSES